MTRTKHKAHPTPGFPVYCLDWASDNELLMGGGGGASKSGIDNKIKLVKISDNGREVTEINEIKLSNEEDAPMTIAVDRDSKKLVTGINASSSSIQKGSNPQCRLFTFEDNKLAPKNKVGTITAAFSADDYPYQKLTAISPDSKYVAIGTTDNLVSVLSFPSLETAFPAVSLDAEVVDLDWGGKKGDWLAVTTVTAVHLYRIVGGEKPTLSTRQVVQPPSANDNTLEFRSAKFSRGPNPFRLHAVLNSTKAKGKAATQQRRKAWVVTYAPNPTVPAHLSERERELLKSIRKTMEANKTAEEGSGAWEVFGRREVGNKAVTVFDASPDGKLLAYGCSDLSIGILDAKTLSPLLKILKAHSFPPTALKFNPTTKLLVSASADNTIRAIVVPASFSSGIPLPAVILIWAFLLLLVALNRPNAKKFNFREFMQDAVVKVMQSGSKPRHLQYPELFDFQPPQFGGKQAPPPPFGKQQQQGNRRVEL